MPSNPQHIAFVEECLRDAPWLSVLSMASLLREKYDATIATQTFYKLREKVRQSFEPLDRPAKFKHLSDREWSMISDEIPALKATHFSHPRDCLDGILWVAGHQLGWRDLPSEYATRSSCERRFHAWRSEGIFDAIFTAFLVVHDQETQRQWLECMRRLTGRAPGMRAPGAARRGAKR